MKFRKVMWYSHQQEAFALPAALFLLLVLSAAGVVISTAANNSLQEIVVDNTRQETFLVSEGAANQIFGDMSSAPETWRSMTPLSDLPADYTEYSPQSYSSSNGIPTCSGVACHRDLFPTGGGLLKNFGPTGGDGEVVDTSFPITEQLNPDDLPEADVTLNSMQSWTQVERLDESLSLIHI
mgnify:FL=1